MAESLQTVQGVVLTSDATFDKAGVQGLKVVDVSLAGELFQLETILKIPEAGLDWEGIEGLKLRIQDYFLQKGALFTVVDLPEQEVTDGVVLFLVRKSKFGKISYQGKEKFCSKIHAKEGELIDEEKLFDDLAFLNENPFHYTDVIVAPGSSSETTDMEFVTRESFPFKVLAGADNTGNAVAGRTRFFASLIWGDAWGRGDLLSYQFSSGFAIDEFHSHTLNSVTYFPWKDILTIFGSYAFIKSEHLLQGFQDYGKALLSSLRYTIPLNPYHQNPRQDVSAGLDYKFFTTDLFFVGTEQQADLLQFVSRSATNVLACYLGYTLKYKSPRHELRFTVETFTSPCTFLPHQSVATYDAMRKGAARKFFYVKAAFEERYRLPWDFQVGLTLRGQGATGRLLPADQLAVGGYSTVRGYSERIFLADNALIGNLEIQTKGYPIIKKVASELSFLLFMDYAWGKNYPSPDSLSQETAHAILWSVGPGIRLNIPPYLEGRLDFGFKLHAVSFDSTAIGRFHLAITMSY